MIVVISRISVLKILVIHTQTKGKVESGVKYVKGNMWPSMRFTDDAGLNRQALEWCDSVANRRVHGQRW